MATDKIITVTTIPTKTADTVASYNAYSSVDGLLGSLTPAEAATGKTFSLSDANHNITVKAVWTTAGESTTNVSNIVVVDLSVINLITNGTMDIESDWSYSGPNIAITGGVMVWSAPDSLKTANQSTTMVENGSYKITYTISNYVGGDVKVFIGSSGSVVGTIRTANGTYVETLVNTATAGHDMFYITAGGVTRTFDIDNVIIEDVT